MDFLNKLPKQSVEMKLRNNFNAEPDTRYKPTTRFEEFLNIQDLEAAHKFLIDVYEELRDYEAGISNYENPNSQFEY